MTVIHVVGLGPGDVSGVPLGTYQQMQSGLPVFLRTRVHPVVDHLEREGLVFTSFDDLYERGGSFAVVYQSIADRLLELARTQNIVYAVPGHPLMAEQSVQILLETAPDGIDIVIGPGQSFVDAVCTTLRIDPVAGLLLLDATAIDADQLHPAQPTLIAQVYHPTVASDVKLCLMEVYPDDYLIDVVRAAGVKEQEQVARVPLYELDRLDWIDHLTTVFVPASTDQTVLRRDPAFLTALVRQLRNPEGGCPWDLKQTHETLRPYVIEEAYEVADAIDTGNPDDLTSELGDLLLQVLLHAQIASETGDFSLRDVYEALADKLIRRHPHVFGDDHATSEEDAQKRWSQAKAAESTDDMDGSESVFDKVRRGRPALAMAFQLQAAAAKVGFDWPDIVGPIDKVVEECQELKAELVPLTGLGDDSPLTVTPEMTDEAGDLLFSAINVVRRIGLEPEVVLAQANRKFERRLQSVEDQLKEHGQQWADLTMDQLDEYWERAKRQTATR